MPVRIGIYSGNGIPQCEIRCRVWFPGKIQRFVLMMFLRSGNCLQCFVS